MTIQDQRVAAAEILGWRLFPYLELPNETLYAPPGFRVHISSAEPFDNLPNCPEDHNDAFRLVEALYAEGFEPDINKRQHGWTVTMWKSCNEYAVVTADTLALAITQAALRAKGRWVQEGEGE